MKSPAPNRIIKLSLLFYLPIIGGSLLFIAPGLLGARDMKTLAVGLGVALLAGLIVVAASRYVSRATGWGRALREEFRAVLGPLGSRDILLLSLLSGFGEEILFRGLVQQWLGLWFTAALFGLFHFPYRRALLPWTAFALALGVVLGVLTEEFQTLWPAIFLHFFINYFNLHDLAEGQQEQTPDGH